MLLEENHDAVLLYLYYTINCPTLLGIYQTDDKDDRVSIRYPLKKFKKARNSILKSGKIVFEEGWVWVVGKGNRIKGRKQWACARKLLRELPKELKLKGQFVEKYGHIAIQYQCPIDGVSPVALPIPIPIPKEKDKTLSPDFLQRAEKLKTLILQNNLSAKVRDSKWENIVRLMVERDKRTLEQIDAVIEWSQGHEFEKTVVLSMGKLRERFDSLTMKMKREGKKKSQPWEDEIK
ncbi:MAG: hypothetical protein IMF11_20205 [Proteobacteria bacterium]|nr:hypothetical protein [Pseudomonadota bacterium]